jgi:acyl-lipid omega-6 desaturase (Delta-12 desaturase)
MVQDPTETRALAELLARYRQANNARGIFELMITAVPFFVIWALMLIVVVRGHWICLLLAVPAAGLLVRLFMIQHDCGHGRSSAAVLRTIGSAEPSALLP